MEETFIMLKRTEITNDLLECHPNAFLLLTQIALRARRTPNLIKKLDVCECQIGDFRSCGLTEQKYRTAKKVLENLGLVTFHATRKGTIAKLANTAVYNINVCELNGQDNEQATDKQRTANEQVTTNNNVNKENKVNNEIIKQEFEKFWNLYGKKKDKTKCFNKWKKLKETEKQEIFKTLPAYINSTPDIQYRKNPQTYLNGKNWEDEDIGRDKRTDNEKFKDPNYYGKDTPYEDGDLF